MKAGTLTGSDQPPASGCEYERILFTGQNLSAVDFSRAAFSECGFKNCQLTNNSLTNCKLQRVQFTGCKLQGLDFSQCHPFLLRLLFTDCLLFSCAFPQMDLQQTVFKDCSLKECDFVKTDLRKAEFDNCALPGTVFRECNLGSADFRTAREYRIDPNQNKLKKAKFSYPEVAGLLFGLDIEIS